MADPSSQMMMGIQPSEPHHQQHAQANQAPRQRDHVDGREHGVHHAQRNSERLEMLKSQLGAEVNGLTEQ